MLSFAFGSMPKAALFVFLRTLTLFHIGCGARFCKVRQVTVLDMMRAWVLDRIDSVLLRQAAGTLTLVWSASGRRYQHFDMSRRNTTNISTILKCQGLLNATLHVTFLHWIAFVHNLNITEIWILNIFKIHLYSKNLLNFLCKFT
jgi:hypothetical protein